MNYLMDSICHNPFFSELNGLLSTALLLAPAGQHPSSRRRQPPSGELILHPMQVVIVVVKGAISVRSVEHSASHLKVIQKKTYSILI